MSRDTRAPKTGRSPDELRIRWHAEAAALGIDASSLTAAMAAAARLAPAPEPVRVDAILTELAEHRSVWHRLDVLRTLCDLAPPQPGQDGASWAAALERAVDTVLADCIDLDPAGDTGQRRSSDGRSIWTEPIAAQATSEHVLAQEERILTWAMSTQVDDPRPAVDIDPLDVDEAQLAAACAVAGEDQLVVIVGPAGAGKTRMLDTAVYALQDRGRPVIGVAPTARGADVLHWEANLDADTVARLIWDFDNPGPDSIAAGLPDGTTLIVDEAGMLNTADLHRLVEHVDRHRWRLVLVGDPYQLAPVGRGGMFTELCDSVRAIELDKLHRFTEPWEASASLALRRGDSRSLDVYEAFDRIRAGRLDRHLDTIADIWLDCDRRGETLAITTTRNDDVAVINEHIQRKRATVGQLDPGTIVPIGDEWAMIGDVVATRHNNRRLRTSRGDHVRNRERWIVSATHPNGDLTVSRLHGHGAITLPAAYAAEFVELAYATTEYGAQGVTADRSLTLATTATTGRGLYVGMTRAEREPRPRRHGRADARRCTRCLEGTLRSTVPTCRPSGTVKKCRTTPSDGPARTHLAGPPTAQSWARRSTSDRRRRGATGADSSRALPIRQCDTPSPYWSRQCDPRRPKGKQLEVLELRPGITESRRCRRRWSLSGTASTFA